jgi:hypothetical protein
MYVQNPEIGKHNKRWSDLIQFAPFIIFLVSPFLFQPILAWIFVASLGKPQQMAKIIK